MDRLFIIKGIIIFFFLSVLGVCSSENTVSLLDEKKIFTESAFDKIHSLRQKAKFEEAKQIANQYLKQYPNDLDMWLYFGLIQLDEKDYEYAEQIFRAILKKNPHYLDARLAIIRVKQAEKKYDEASILIAQGLMITPQNEKLLTLKNELNALKNPPHQSANQSNLSLDRIQTLYKEKKLSEAKKLAESELKARPNDMDVKLFLGYITYQEGHDEEAQAIFQDILEKVPTYLDARVALIRLKINHEEWEKASSLIDQGLIKNPEDKRLLALKEQMKQTVTSSKTVLHEKKEDVLPALRALRDKGKLQEAINKAIKYLKTNPQDVDVALILGLIYQQEKKYPKAEIQLQFVLNHTPRYVDARVALIQIKLLKHDFKSAQNLISEGLRLDLHEKRFITLKNQLDELIRGKNKKVKPLSFDERILKKAKQYIQEKQYSDARRLLKQAILQYPHHVKFHIAMADYYLKFHRDIEALNVIRRALKLNPMNYSLLLKEGEIHIVLRQYALAAQSYQDALTVLPSDYKKQNLFGDLNEHSPRYQNGLNEVGLWTDNAYVSDLHSIWDYSGVYYTRDTNLGQMTFKINYASRLQTSAPQYELNLAPRFTRNIYIEFKGGYSNQPILFPNYFFSAEPYINIPQFAELSAGALYAKINNTYLKTWTSSLNFYPGKYWLSLRPYYFVPQSKSPITRLPAHTSILYTARARRYLGTDDHYLGIGIGVGQSPDLSDLLSVDFIVIKNNFINLDYSVPILGYRLVMNISSGYQRWKYPSGLVRNLYDGQVGFKYRF